MAMRVPPEFDRHDVPESQPQSRRRESDPAPPQGRVLKTTSRIRMNIANIFKRAKEDSSEGDLG